MRKLFCAFFMSIACVAMAYEDIVDYANIVDNAKQTEANIDWYVGERAFYLMQTTSLSETAFGMPHTYFWYMWRDYSKLFDAPFQRINILENLSKVKF